MPDGRFARPSGRQRKGCDWDYTRGVWVPIEGYQDQGGGSSRSSAGGGNSVNEANSNEVESSDFRNELGISWRLKQITIELQMIRFDKIYRLQLFALDWVARRSVMIYLFYL